MATAWLSPVFMAEPKALAEVLDTEPGEPNRARVVAVLKAVLPDVEQTPARMKRLNNALGEWLLKGPRSWQEVEESRQELVEIMDAQTANVSRILAAAAGYEFPSEELDRLRRALDEMRQLRTQIFENWQSFTSADSQAALEEIRQGKICDLDEVLRELQGRAH